MEDYEDGFSIYKPDYSKMMAATAPPEDVGLLYRIYNDHKGIFIAVIVVISLSIIWIMWKNYLHYIKNIFKNITRLNPIIILSHPVPTWLFLIVIVALAHNTWISAGARKEAHSATYAAYEATREVSNTQEYVLIICQHIDARCSTYP